MRLLGVLLKSNETIERSPSAETETASPWFTSMRNSLLLLHSQRYLKKKIILLSPSHLCFCVCVCVCSWAFYPLSCPHRTIREPLEGFTLEDHRKYFDNTSHWRSLLKDRAKFGIQ
jgi:hypothetical protein